jgi:hypothetical protein
MMEHVEDDFYVEDETPQEVERSLALAKTVLVIPSGLRQRLRRQTRRLRHIVATDLRRGAQRVDVEPLQVAPERQERLSGESAPLPPLVQENLHDEAVMEIWAIERLPEDVRLGMITLALEMRRGGDRNRDSA